MARKIRIPKTYKNVVIELSGEEGFSYEDLRVTDAIDLDSTKIYGGEHRKSEQTIKLYVKVIGFCDDKAPIRNWGVNKLFCKNAHTHDGVTAGATSTGVASALITSTSVDVLT